MVFQFPYSTCENPKRTEIKTTSILPHQPFSFYTNCLAVAIIFCFLLYVLISKRIRTKDRFYLSILFTSFLLFEAWHAFSHFYHFKEEEHHNKQAYIAHFLFYAIILSTLFALHHLSRSRRSLSRQSIELFNGNKFYLYTFILLIFIDLYFIWKFRGLFMMLSGFTILLFVYYTHFHLIPGSLRKYMYAMIILLLVLIILVVNESLFCDRMMEKMQFPYHIFVEFIGTILFTLLCIFYLFIFQYNEMIG